MNFEDMDDVGFSIEQWNADEGEHIAQKERDWKNTGVSFGTATEAGNFLISQGFTCCDGGFQKIDELDGDRVFASYVLTKRRCFIRLLVV